MFLQEKVKWYIEIKRYSFPFSVYKIGKIFDDKSTYRNFSCEMQITILNYLTVSPEAYIILVAILSGEKKNKFLVSIFLITHRLCI